MAAMTLTLGDLVDASAAVGATGSRLAKVDALAAVLRRADGEADLAAALLAGTVPHGRLGVGYRSLRSLPDPAPGSSLTLDEVDAAFSVLATAQGSGSARVRADALDDLFGRATAPEQRFLSALLTGELRQGALDAVMLLAIARAADVPEADVRRAAMLAGRPWLVATPALRGGVDALSRITVEVGRPIAPMLAASAASLPEAMGAGEVLVDRKLDGIRVQLHRRDGAVSVFTRSLDDITARVPDVVAAVDGLPGGDFILDGEAIALDASGRPHPFQVTGARTASTRDPAALMAATPLTTVLFDVLVVDGDVVIDEPLTLRRDRLASLAPTLLVDCVTTADADVAAGFFSAQLAAGHEGVVVKDPSSLYTAGRRGAGWVKVKPHHTLDLVVLAVERGSGRRSGLLSNIHLGARDEDTGGFVMLGKTFKGMTDAMLAWQTERFTALAVDDDGWTVTVRPEQVVEVAFDSLQRSTRYPGGLALRFARVVRYRDDKSAAQADTIGTVRALAAR